MDIGISVVNLKNHM